MYKLLRLIFMGYWHDKPVMPAPPVHHHKWKNIKEIKKSGLARLTFIPFESLVFIDRCETCGEIRHYEVG